MADEVMDDFLEEYDALTSDVSNAGHGEFVNNLKRWVQYVNDRKLSGPVIHRLTSGLDFAAWFQIQNASGGSMAGSKRFDWPLETDKRVGMQLKLVAELAAGSIRLTDLLVDYFFKTNNLNLMVGEFNSQLFDPMARDLRRLVVRSARPSIEIPASDRVVRINHNSVEYLNTDRALAGLEQALEQANDYPDLEDKSQKLAEVSAVRRLLRATRVRVEAVVAVIVKSLRWLADHFAGGVIGYFAEDALAALRVLLNAMM